CFELREQGVVDEVEERVASDTLGVGSPDAPLQGFRDWRAVIDVEQFEFHILVVNDLEKKHPAELGEALGITINADVLAHDVLNGFDSCSDRHERVLHPLKTKLSPAKLARQLRCAALDVHFARPTPVLPPGSATLQRGFWSRARSRRSQGKPWRTGSGLLKQTSRRIPDRERFAVHAQRARSRRACQSV